MRKLSDYSFLILNFCKNLLKFVILNEEFLLEKNVLLKFVIKILSLIDLVFLTMYFIYAVPFQIKF